MYRRKLLKPPPRIYKVRGRQYGAPPMPTAYERRGGTPQGWLGYAAERKANQLARRKGKTRSRLASSVSRGMAPEFAATKMEGRYGTPYTEEIARYKPEQAIQTAQAFVAPEREALGVRGLTADVGTKEAELGRLPALYGQQDVTAKRVEEEAIAAEARRAAEELRTQQQFARTEALAGERAPIETELLQQQVEGAPITPQQQYERKQAELSEARKIAADPSTERNIAEYYAQEARRLQTDLAGLEVKGSPLPAPKLGEPMPDVAPPVSPEAEQRFTAPPVPKYGTAPVKEILRRSETVMGLDEATNVAAQQLGNIRTIPDENEVVVARQAAAKIIEALKAVVGQPELLRDLQANLLSKDEIQSFLNLADIQTRRGKPRLGFGSKREFWSGFNPRLHTGDTDRNMIEVIQIASELKAALGL